MPAQCIITDDHIAQWSGNPNITFTADERDRIAAAIQHSTIPEALGDIVFSVLESTRGSR